MLVVAYYERWSGRAADRLTRNASVDQPAPAAPEKPAAQDTTARPYLFGRGQFRRVPQLGWERPHDEFLATGDTPLSAPARARSFPEYRRQPQLGWQQAASAQVDAPTPDWRPTRQWAGWTRQPSLGFTAPSDQDAEKKTPGPSWQATRQWLGYRPQPQLGWNGAADAGFAPTGDTPLQQPLRPFLFRGYRSQPELGWSSAHDDEASAVPDVAWSSPRAAARWRPQPQLGWTPAQDQPDTPLISWQPTRLWATWKPQPQAGWQQGTDSEPEATRDNQPFPWQATRQWARWQPQPWFGWWADYSFSSEAPPTPQPTPDEAGGFIPLRRIVVRGRFVAEAAEFVGAGPNLFIWGRGRWVAPASAFEGIGGLSMTGRMHAVTEGPGLRGMAVQAKAGEVIVVIDDDNDDDISIHIT